ncbi:MAG TPA: chitobiase/beta-hexosaminidase C-terminal domain-containing protein, partial [Bacteroidales bacterium]|nr:chitobiase/beta-hexosaminidase C-terminal domain-containing protein [Bacteroidales bacterium]
MRLRIPAISLVILICSSAAGQIEFSSGSGYRYLKGINASDLPADWMTSQYNDSEWSEGNAPFRYGDGTGGVVLTDMMNSYSTLYLRSSFNAFSIDRIKTISFRVNYDDGFVIWVNGTRVMARNAPATLSYNALATANHESGTFETFQLDSSDVQLVEGTNLLCIQAFNVSLNSSDFYFDMAVNASLSLPEVPETLPLNFDHEAGFCETPFDLVISSGQPGYDVIYTIDGSNPQTSSTATRSNTAVTLRIDPAISAGRPATPVFLVRASLVIDGYSPSRPVTKSFIFLDKVLTQGHPGGEWPSSPVNGQVIDLGMDPGVVNDPRYSQQMKASLTDIPSISLVTDLADMFGASRGIYVNAYQHGEEWERQCSLELINPDNTIGFRVNAGVRIRGGASRSPDNPKHAFRLFFRKEYGPGKLLYPLFGDEGAAEFDKVDLRTEQNYS